VSPGSASYGASGDLTPQPIVRQDACGRKGCRHHRADHDQHGCWLCGCQTYRRTDTAGVAKAGRLESLIVWGLILASSAFICWVFALAVTR